MKSNAITTKLVLFTKRPRSDGSCTVKLRVTYQRKKVYYAIHSDMGQTIKMRQDEWDRLWDRGVRGKAREMALYLQSVELAAREIIGRMSVFSFNHFKLEFFGGCDLNTEESDLLKDLELRKEALLSEGRVKSALLYSDTRSSFAKFIGNRTKLPYDAVNEDWLQSYENYMKSRGASITTVGMYLRNVRTLFNSKIKAGFFSESQYPFGKDKYVIPTGRNVKKALAKEQVKKLADYEPKNPTEGFYQDLWIFSYLCNGMNFKDIALLKYKNLTDETMSFERAKPGRSKRGNPKIIQVYLGAKQREILERWKTKPALPENYVFPIFESGMDAWQQFRKLDQVVKSTNLYVRRIANECGIKENVTTYVARHSFASVLRRAGASSEFIQESFGHSDLRTTENYLADFEIEEKKKWSAELL